MSGIKIEGMSDLLRTFEGAPKEVLKSVAKAMRKAGAETARNMRANVPRSFKRLVKSKVTTSRLTGNLAGGIGLYKGKTEGNEIPEWFKAYWKNYGTLQRRDPSHIFDRPVKGDGTSAARRRRNKIGQWPEKFFEDSIPAGWESKYMDTVIRKMRAQGFDISR